jgi:hypothetical protein
MMHAENLENEFYASFVNCEQTKEEEKDAEERREEVNVEVIREEGV